MNTLDQTTHPIIELLKQHGIEAKCVQASEPSLEDDMLEVVFPKDPMFTVGVQLLGMGEYMVFKSKNTETYAVQYAQNRTDEQLDLLVDDVKAFIPQGSGVVELKNALVEFVSDVESCGGLVQVGDNTFAPVGSEEWTDIGATAIKAKAALKNVGIDVELTITK